jgi:hypothetical protein
LTPDIEQQDSALLALLESLAALGYEFVTVTPETHKRAIAGRGIARDLRDIFGWSLPFDERLLPADLRDALGESGMLARHGDLCRSRVRISSLGSLLFLHSAFPTEAADSVFFGPDSYRFAALIRAEMPKLGPVRRIADIGTGAGVGAIAAAGLAPGAKIAMTDINPLALRFARINARHAGVDAEAMEGKGLTGVSGPIDLAVANPPFIIDPAKRAYRDGGEMRGAKLSLDWAIEAAERLEPGGTMLLYTGSAIVAGRDRLREALEAQLGKQGCALRYREIDPDIFGEMLREPGYEDVERLAAVGAVIEKCA